MPEAIEKVGSLMAKLTSKIMILFLLFVLVGTSVLANDCPIGFKRPSYKTRSAYCSTGEYVKDAYNFGKKILCEQMEVDHLIPLKIAHCAGLSQDQLKRFANDPRNLRFTNWRTNRAKGAKDLHTFLQTLDPKLRKKVLLDGVMVLQDYNIPVGPQITGELARLASAVGPLNSNASKLLSKKRDALLKRMSRRVVTSMSRGIAAAQPQAATGILAPMALAIIAWEVYDACQQLTDLDELKQINSSPDLIIEDTDEEATCGMSKSELVQAFTGKDAAFEKCVDARLQRGIVDPPECQDYPIELPHGNDIASDDIVLELPHKQ